MSDSIKNKANVLVGTVKENIGKAIDSEQIELEGKLQKLSGEAGEKVKEAKKKAKDISEEAKEAIAEKANDLIDSLMEKEKEEK